MRCPARSPRGSCARRRAAASTRPRAASCWATARRGSGTWPTEHFPGAVQIVDRFHAKQHLSDVGKAIYGATTALARAWARERHDELDAGDLDAVLAALRAHAATHDEARKCVDYVERNRERMRYPEFRAAGLVYLDRAWSRRAARSPSAPAASGPACTGRSPGPTPSSRCGAAR